ncbi:MAG: ABC transporter ATP-binding protein [Treponema sp.]|nr:ABC transporter ATP-binding protein [Treponema sp.]
MHTPLLTISDLHKSFNLEAGFFARFGRFVNAVNGISFTIGKNETYGLVGESGCGKTTTARLLVRMYEADSGTIRYNGENGEVDIPSLQKEELKAYRQKVKYVFQDPARSLNPRMSICEVLISGLRHQGTLRKEKQLKEKAAAALEEVGLAATDLDKRPSEFSGGQRQRISIARSLLPQPELLICDEVVSALDVSIQSQILNLLLDIREKRIADNRTMSFLFIAHDLKVACYFCDRIGVMYSGKLVEEAPAASLMYEGCHPYTRMLFASATGMKSWELKPHVPTTEENALPCLHAKAHCAFAQRCPQATERCFSQEPPAVQVTASHTVRCHNFSSPLKAQ